MKKSKGKQITEVVIPQGYEPEDLCDTDSEGYGYDNEAPAYQEEVKLTFERNKRQGKNI